MPTKPKPKTATTAAANVPPRIKRPATTSSTIKRAELTGPLAGHWVELDSEKLNMGLIADLQEAKFGAALDGLAAAITASDLIEKPGPAAALAWLRSLGPTGFGAVCTTLTSTLIN